MPYRANYGLSNIFSKKLSILRQMWPGQLTTANFLSYVANFNSLADSLLPNPIS